MVRLVVIGSLLLASACGGPPTRRARRPQRTPDAAIELAALLPDGVDRCVVVRPGRLPARRRALIAFQSWAEPWVWDSTLGVRAYASAEAEAQQGRRARRTFVRFGPDSDPEAVRELPVRWADEDCSGIECRLPVARWLDERTIEIQRHPWPRREMAASSAECVQLARNHVASFEVAADTTIRAGALPIPEPRVHHRVLISRRSTVSFQRTQIFRDAVDAAVRESWIRERGPLVEPMFLPLPPSRRRLSRSGTRLTMTDVRRWDELELALEDERLRRRALAIFQRRSEPTTVSLVDVRNLAVVRHQVRLRRDAMLRTRGAAREREATALAELLETALAVHTTNGELGRSLVRLSLDQLHDPARASRAVERMFLTGVVGDSPDWLLLRREVASLGEATTFAALLLADGIATSPSDASIAAADLRSLREGGVPYDWAEGAWQTSRLLLPHETWESRTVVSTDAEISIEGIVAALLAVARAPTPRSDFLVQVAVRTAASGDARAIGESRPELVAVHDPRRSASMIVVAAAPTADVGQWRRIGATLRGAVAPGPIEIGVELRDSSQRVVTRFRLRGELTADRLRVQRVNAALVGVEWPLLQRYIARPLAELPTALFPPPELVIRTESEEAANRLRGWISEAREPPIRASCTFVGPSVRCRFPGALDGLDDFIVRVAARRLALRPAEAAQD